MFKRRTANKKNVSAAVNLKLTVVNLISTVVDVIDHVIITYECA